MPAARTSYLFPLTSYFPPVTDLDRLFRHLVRTLGASDPGLLHRPIALTDLTMHVIPYRSARRVIGIDSSEDYELLVLRLVSGESGLVATEPEAARARFAEEAASPNPDLRVLRELGGATVHPTPAALTRALSTAEDEVSYAPTPIPTPAPPPLLPPAAVRPAPPSQRPRPTQPDIVPQPPPPAPVFCGACGGKLPHGRTVLFCPTCGRSLRSAHCPSCGEEVERSWKHCVNCGEALGWG